MYYGYTKLLCFIRIENREFRLHLQTIFTEHISYIIEHLDTICRQLPVGNLLFLVQKGGHTTAYYDCMTFINIIKQENVLPLRNFKHKFWD